MAITRAVGWVLEMATEKTAMSPPTPSSQARVNGEKYAVVNGVGKPVYPGDGVALNEAVRLATSLVSGAGLARIESDGVLTPGRLDSQSGTFQPAA